MPLAHYLDAMIILIKTIILIIIIIIVIIIIIIVIIIMEMIVLIIIFQSLQVSYGKNWFLEVICLPQVLFL